ncbi:hypothetical protein JEZ13_03095 [bacterium]|nr:hypothetical protein [bacterium]
MIDISFLESKQVFRRTYLVETYNTSYFQTIKVSDLYKYLQDVASQHSESMKIGYDDLKVINGAWVLTKQLLEVIRLPKALEEFTIHTWSHKHNKIVATRNFIITDQNKAILVKVVSDWLVLNLEKRRIVPLSKINMDYIQSYDYELFPQPLAKIEVIEDNLVNEFSKRVRFSDIDLNGHMNNTVYVDMVLDSMAEFFKQRHKLKQINTNFIQEVKFLEEIAIRTFQVKNNLFHHKIIRSIDNCELFTAITEWDK